MKTCITAILCVAIFFSTASFAGAKTASQYKMPDSVIDISKENTYPDQNQSIAEFLPSAATRALLKTANVPVDNPVLIRALNESSLHPSKWSIGYSARIYLGEWPLNYLSKTTSVNGTFKKINDAPISSGDGKNICIQKVQQKVDGGLTSDVPEKEEAEQMILAKTKAKTGFPLALSATVGAGTKISCSDSGQTRQDGHLYTYVPAVHERGKVTYGEVYLILKGGRAQLDAVNMTQQDTDAWLPFANHVTVRGRTR